MVSSCIRPTIGFCARPIPTTTLIATRHAEDSPTLRALAEFPPRPLADSRGVLGVRRGSGSGAWGLPHRQDSAPGVWQAEAHGGIGRTGQTRARAACGVFGVGGTTDRRSLRVYHRVGRAAWQDAHPVERGRGARSRRTEPGIVGVGVIQITPQMRILVAIEPVDGRKGIDSLARLCQDKLQADPFSGCLFVFRSRRGSSIRILVYDGQGFWLAQKRLSQGRFVWWPSRKEPSRVLQAHQAQLLLAAGNPDTEAAPVWRKVS